MTDLDLDTIYKANVGESHYAAMRGLFDAGWDAHAAITPTAATPDQSLTATAPTAVETVLVP